MVHLLSIPICFKIHIYSFSIWAFKITRKDSESKQGGKVSTRILPIIVDLDIDPWEKITLVISMFSM